MAEPLLSLRGVKTDIGHYHILHGVAFDVAEGGLTMLLGRNGAGKTTTLRTIMGLWHASAGTIRFGGGDITQRATPDISQAGIAYVPENMGIFGDLTVRENVRIAVQSRAGIGLDLLSRWTRHTDLIDEAEQLLRRVNLTAQATSVAGALPHGDQRKLEVAILLALEPDIFMFDEPTAGMSVDEVPVILDLIHAIKETGDRTILLVEHKMDVVRSLADRIIVLHNGALVADGEPAAVIASPIVREAYLGGVPNA